MFAFGRMVGDWRQGRTLLVTMTVIFVTALMVVYWSQAHGNPALTALGVDPSMGNMEGEDVRFGQAGTALFIDATTGTGTGASNVVLEFGDPGRRTGRHVQLVARLHLARRGRHGAL